MVIVKGTKYGKSKDFGKKKKARRCLLSVGDELQVQYPRLRQEILLDRSILIILGVFVQQKAIITEGCLT